MRGAGRRWSALAIVVATATAAASTSTSVGKGSMVLGGLGKGSVVGTVHRTSATTRVVVVVVVARWFWRAASVAAVAVPRSFSVVTAVFWARRVCILCGRALLWGWV